jgi:RNA polymerase sigma factor (sigma-70 family)
MPTPLSSTVLIEQLKAGDYEAAQPLWERYYPRLVALARKKLRGRTPLRAADEEDVALSAFKSFCAGAREGRFPRLKDADGLWAMLVLITVRKAADLANRNRRQKRGGGKVRGESVFDRPAGDGKPGGLQEFAGKDPSPDLPALLAEEFERLLNQLEDDQQRSVLVGKLEGRTNAEVAHQIGRSEATVERELRLIRKLLQEG